MDKSPIQPIALTILKLSTMLIMLVACVYAWWAAGAWVVDLIFGRWAAGAWLVDLIFRD